MQLRSSLLTHILIGIMCCWDWCTATGKQHLSSFWRTTSRGFRVCQCLPSSCGSFCSWTPVTLLPARHRCKQCLLIVRPISQAQAQHSAGDCLDRLFRCAVLRYSKLQGPGLYMTGADWTACVVRLTLQCSHSHSMIQMVTQVQ
jgi:hypothetical protein